MRVAIESLENRRLMSTSPFGPLTVTPLALQDEVAGQPLVNSRTEITGGFTLLALLDANVPDMVVHWGDGSKALKTTTMYVSDNRVVGGLPTVSAHAYARPGNYTMHVDFKYQGHTVAGFSKLVHVGQNSPLGLTLREKSGAQFDEVLGSFQAVPTVAAQSAVIDWGDGQTSNATLANNDNGQAAQVTGSHTYPRPGKYRVSVTGTFATNPPPGGYAVAVVSFQKMFSTIIVRRHG